MPQRYWSGTIDGTPLVDGADVAGFELTGAEAFESSGYASSITVAMDGYPHKLRVPLQLYGLPLEIKFIHAPATLLREIVDKLKNRDALGQDFRATFADGFQTLNNLLFTTNGSEWYSRGNPDGAYINDAVIRLICRGA
jgi:hypothetical protein